MRPNFWVKCYKPSEFAKSRSPRDREPLKAIKIMLIEEYKERVKKGLPIFKDEDSNKN